MCFPKYFFLFLLLFHSLQGHPIPDIPVLGAFEINGSSRILVEIDTRSFAEDPEEVPFLTKSVFDNFPNEKTKNLLLQAQEMIKNSLSIKFGNQPWFLPDFKYKFIEVDDSDAKGESIVTIQANYDIILESNSSYYQIKSMNEAPYDLVFSNLIDGKPQKRVNVLFPGEESFKLDLSFIDKDAKVVKEVNNHNLVHLSKKSKEERTADARSTFFSFGRQGFLHVLPLGLDHILFVVGLFLLSRKWKPVLYQVSVFTAAHTITLGLASLELISAPSNVVEPIIAASIAVIAFENIFFPATAILDSSLYFYLG